VVTAREEDEDPRLKELMQAADDGLDVTFPSIARPELLIVFYFKHAVWAYRSISVTWCSALTKRLHEQGMLKEPFLYIVEHSSWVETFRAEGHSSFTDEYRQAPEWYARPKVHYVIQAHPYWIEVIADETPLVETHKRLWTDQVGCRGIRPAACRHKKRGRLRPWPRRTPIACSRDTTRGNLVSCRTRNLFIFICTPSIPCSMVLAG